LNQRVAAQPAPSWKEIFEPSTRGLTVGLTLITLSVATESLIVTTIMPAIVHDIGGLSLYGLAFSAFFLAGLASIPIAGWAVDRTGPAPPFAATMLLFLAGTLAAVFAPSMALLVVARVLQGFGAGAQLTISQSTIARAYPTTSRIRVLSLMSASWTVPSLLGPSVGAVIASLWGWRWAFAIILLPTSAAIAVTLPRLREVLAPDSHREPPDLRRPFQIALGAGLVILALTNLAWWTALLGVVGLGAALEGLMRVLPPGTLRARRGLPAIVASGFFLNFGFYAAASFVPLTLVSVRGLSLVAAGVVVAVNSITWSLGVFINTRLVDRYRRPILVAASTMALAACCAMFASALVGAPLLIAFLTWPLAGLSMGIAFNTLTLGAMDIASAGREGFAMSGRNLAANLGTAVGTGVAGAIVALAQERSQGIRAGLLVTYGLAALAIFVASLIGRRMQAGTESG
jgi:MFS family permease